MLELILSIEECDFDNYSGFIIQTTHQRIKLGIDNRQNCCENWGYFLSEDNFSEFIGANLIDIKLTDTLLKAGDFDVNNMYEGDVMFVDLVCDIGTLQFVAYNEHNGYYGHTACVVSRNLNHEECL